MVALRTRPKGGVLAPFGLSTLAFALLPAPIGTQDLGAMFSYRAAAAHQARPAPYFPTLHVATFRFPQPPGTAIPRPAGYRLASLDPHVLGISRFREDDDKLKQAGNEPAQFPIVNRRLKGDSLVPVRSVPDGERAPDARLANASPNIPASAADPPPPTESSFLLDGINADGPPVDGVWPELGPVELSLSLSPTLDTARLYFGEGPLDAPPGELDRTEVEIEAVVSMSQPANATADGKGGETVAEKGEVTGEGKHPLSPAERLKLTGKARIKSEKCLANAVYFEARGESVRGQIAVAQVVMNRVFFGFYPNNVCGVVYQNAHRYNACQFTFACDRIRDVVTEPDAWERAKRIAKDVLDGKLWLDDVGKATHYHAYWVRPWWIRTMRKLHKIGVHSFYRPRRWGDGSDEPVWGDAKLTAALVKTL
jgi:spore germination cell wall hydrolase CwlJ-like protein